MIVVLISWLYLFIICSFIGAGVFALLKKLFPDAPKGCLSSLLAAGITAITVFAEYFSIFYRISMAAHLILLAAALISGFFCRRRLFNLFTKYRSAVFSWEGFFYLCLLLLTAFFTSRGAFHTDTNIYHAQNIRIYEEAGLIKGMANLQLHYGYNSSYLAFASIFSLKWLLPWSLHTTTGFIEAFLCIYACHGLKDFKKHCTHYADAGRIAILIYAIVNLTGSMSPATDYPTMFLTLYVITAWLENMEDQRSNSAYALLSVMAVFLATMKLSIAALVVIAVYPAYWLIRQKKWKDILLYILLGVIIILPYLIRNVLISGWLVYPFEGINLFHVPWKVPVAYLLVDSAQIKVWGRCLYDVTKLDLPMKDWLPVWWENQERYAQMLLYANVLGILLGAFNLVYKWIKKIKIEPALLFMYFGLFASALVWLFLAPFIRYGLAFLLAIPLIGMGSWFSYKKYGFHSILTGVTVFCILLCFSPYIDHYVTDDGVFIKHQIKEPYYILQKDYDDAETETLTYNGNTIYYSVAGEVNSYHYYPNTCYSQMAERSQLMGNTIQEGFMPIP